MREIGRKREGDTETDSDSLFGVLQFCSLRGKVEGVKKVDLRMK